MKTPSLNSVSIGSHKSETVTKVSSTSPIQSNAGFNSETGSLVSTMVEIIAK
jgi:hypothetical protein